MMLLSLTFVSCYESDNPLFLDLDSLVPGPPLTLEAANEGETMNVTFENTLSKPIDLQYSLDGGQSWQALNIKAGKPGYTDKSSGKHDKRPARRTLSGIKQILIKAENESYGEFSSIGLDNPKEDVDRNLNISVDADCYIYGNIMSLVGGDKFARRRDLREDMTFFYLFAGNANLKSHPTKKLLLPATTLTKKCYRQMFYGCTGLTVAPDLPATTLTERCYSGMFGSCFALTATPVLPAKVLENGCYVCMFNNCTSLTYVKCLATSIASDATTSPTYNWLRSVPASGTFVKDASVDYNTGEFWDTTTQFGSTTKCAAQDVANWTWKNN